MTLHVHAVDLLADVAGIEGQVRALHARLVKVGRQVVEHVG